MIVNSFLSVTTLRKLFYFSGIGDEAILSTLWEKYIDAFDKVFVHTFWLYIQVIWWMNDCRRRRLVFPFLNGSLVLYWLPFMDSIYCVEWQLWDTVKCLFNCFLIFICSWLDYFDSFVFFVLLSLHNFFLHGQAVSMQQKMLAIYQYILVLVCWVFYCKVT